MAASKPPHALWTPSAMIIAAALLACPFKAPHAQGQAGAGPSKPITMDTLACQPEAPSFQIASPSLPAPIHASTSKEITALMGKSAGGHAGQSKVAGLYMSSYTATGTHSLICYGFKNGTTAICLTKLRLDIVQHADILIASELPLGGCADKDAYNHESTHHRIQVQQHNAAVAAFLASPNGKLPLRPFWGSSQEQAVAEVKKWEAAYLDAISASISNYVDPVQRALDSPQEYARFTVHCAAEFAKIKF